MKDKSSGGAGVKKLPALWKNSRAFRIAVIAAAALIAAACVCFGVYKSCLDPYRHEAASRDPTMPLGTTLTARQAAEDMKYVYDRVSETHPCWIDGSQELVAAFDEAYDIQCEYLASMGDNVTVLDEWRSTAALLAVLGDAHTYSNVRPENEPVLRLADGRETETLSPEAVLVGVGGRSVDTLYASFKTMCSYESEVWALRCFKEAVVREPWLRALGIDTTGEIVYEYSDYKYWNSADDRSDEKVIKQCFYRFARPEEAAAAAVSDTDKEKEEEQPAFCDYRIYADDDLAVFRLDECRYNDTYKQTVDSFFAEVKEEGIGSVAVDLRNNTGGNSYVANYFIGYLDTESFMSFGGTDVRKGNFLKRYAGRRETVVPKKNTFSGDVYVLTSPTTFSSAVDFATMISDNGLGKTVGEQPGGMPSSYGDIVVFRTPEAGVLFQVSYKYFHRIDSSKDKLPLIPDIPCGADEALDVTRAYAAGKIKPEEELAVTAGSLLP